VSDSLVRFAFGIEDTEDLVSDVEQALETLKGATNGAGAIRSS